jgi:hypothetical protein
VSNPKENWMWQCPKIIIEQLHLQHITYKILVKILYVKSVLYAEEIIGEYPGGFQRRRKNVENKI